MNIVRNRLSAELRGSIRSSPVTAVLGPRQCGKSHLVRTLGVPAPRFFDLESLTDLARLSADPQGVLGELRGTVVIDEAQRMPELFPLLRHLADREGSPARFVLTGSVSPDLRRQMGESLAGRVRYVDMGGFLLDETGARKQGALLLRGGLPPALLAGSDADSMRWRLDYLRSVVEQDVTRMVASRLSVAQMRRLLLFLAHMHGALWNEAEAARIIEVDRKTIQRYIDLLEHLFFIRLLPPCHANVAKRLRKAHKIYLRDSGLVHALLGLASREHLLAHRVLGASWEGTVMEHVIRGLGVRAERCSHYSVHGGAEVDLVIEDGAGRIGVEMKYSSAPRRTESMRAAMADLGLRRLLVVHSGDASFSMGDGILAVGLQRLDAATLDVDRS